MFHWMASLCKISKLGNISAHDTLQYPISLYRTINYIKQMSALQRNKDCLQGYMMMCKSWTRMLRWWILTFYVNIRAHSVGLEQRSSKTPESLKKPRSTIT